MARNEHPGLAEPSADPFAERHRPRRREQFQLLGGRFRFETDSPQLLRIVREAYRGLPAHTLRNAGPRFSVRLALTGPHHRIDTQNEPPRIRAVSASGLLCGAMETASFVAIAPGQSSALVVVPREMLAFPYHVRYEMLEFAVYVLAARKQGLVPLHAACVGYDGQGILLLGPSGSGKSTVSLHCLAEGLQFLAEDSVLVDPDGMLATGIANFLHARPDSLKFLDARTRASLLGGSSIIRRRSGVEKLEIDLRRPRYRLASQPLRIRAVAFISARRAGARALLAPLAQGRLMQRLAATQKYAAHQPGWARFVRQACRLPAFELRRGQHPHEAVEALMRVLQSSPDVVSKRAAR
ncbi:MAG TPA: hypothetical protein VFB37_17655 [Steroidobacteraceae bacterium]|nr:hypothetical protein [Steroidobacteraceae bacterium]